MPKTAQQIKAFHFFSDPLIRGKVSVLFNAINKNYFPASRPYYFLSYKKSIGVISEQRMLFIGVQPTLRVAKPEHSPLGSKVVLSCIEVTFLAPIVFSCVARHNQNYRPYLFRLIPVYKQMVYTISPLVLLLLSSSPQQG